MSRFSIKHGLYVAALVGAALIPAPRDASAGFRVGYPVDINTTAQTASGGLSSAYNAPDSRQYIGCRTYGFAGVSKVYVGCIAVDEAGTSRSCMTNDANLFAIATSIGADDWVSFAWDTNGRCTRLAVNHYSWQVPKQ
ncbi:MAG: hypothetical protein F9K43_24495 [Bauldia sp.]|nr:MAG: hypothetical protein F9K43_24495 [Bauldia sp.]